MRLPTIAVVFGFALVVSACDGGGGPPPPMVLNTDETFNVTNVPDDVIPVVGDLGGEIMDVEDAMGDTRPGPAAPAAPEASPEYELGPENTSLNVPIIGEDGNLIFPDEPTSATPPLAVPISQVAGNQITDALVAQANILMDMAQVFLTASVTMAGYDPASFWIWAETGYDFYSPYFSSLLFDPEHISDLAFALMLGPPAPSLLDGLVAWPHTAGLQPQPNEYPPASTTPWTTPWGEGNPYYSPLLGLTIPSPPRPDQLDPRTGFIIFAPPRMVYPFLGGSPQQAPQSGNTNTETGFTSPNPNVPVVGGLIQGPQTGNQPVPPAMTLDTDKGDSQTPPNAVGANTPPASGAFQTPGAGTGTAAGGPAPGPAVAATQPAASTPVITTGVPSSGSSLPTAGDYGFSQHDLPGGGKEVIHPGPNGPVHEIYGPPPKGSSAHTLITTYTEMPTTSLSLNSSLAAKTNTGDALVHDLPNGGREVVHPSEFIPGVNNHIVYGPPDASGNRTLIKSFLTPANASSTASNVPVYSNPMVGTPPAGSAPPPTMTLDTDKGVAHTFPSANPVGLPPSQVSTVPGGTPGGAVVNPAGVKRQELLEEMKTTTPSKATGNAVSTSTSPTSRASLMQEMQSTINPTKTSTSPSTPGKGDTATTVRSVKIGPSTSTSTSTSRTFQNPAGSKTSTSTSSSSSMTSRTINTSVVRSPSTVPRSTGQPTLKKR